MGLSFLMRSKMSDLILKSHQSKTVTQYIARQPIFNADKRLFAYELLYRESTDNVFPAGTSDDQATSRLFFNALLLMGVEQLTAHQLAFINLSTDAILNDFPKLLEPHSAVIEIIERATSLPEISYRVKQLKQEGYIFALDDYDGSDKWREILPLMDFIKLEVDPSIGKTQAMIKKLKHRFPHIKVIVERIESYTEFEQLKAAGCDLFQGYFFAKPELLSYGSVDPCKVTVLELLSCTAKADIDFDIVHKKIATDVGLTARILRLVNSRSVRAQTITSISQAVIYLGEDAIRQFVRVLALTELGNDKPQELTKLGLTRAKFIAVLLEPYGKGISDQGYLVGLLSVLDAILDKELGTVANELSLGDDLLSALLLCEGVLGNSLQLVKAIEREQWAEVLLLLKKILPESGISAVFKAMYDARAYADDVYKSLSSVTD